MFRIAVMVEDRKLADVLRSVAGQVHNLEVVPVVINDPATPPTPKDVVKFAKLRDSRGKKSRRDLSPASLGFSAGQTFRANDLVPVIKSLGMSKKSTWYVTMRMLREKTIRRIGSGTYEVIA